MAPEYTHRSCLLFVLASCHLGLVLAEATKSQVPPVETLAKDGDLDTGAISLIKRAANEDHDHINPSKTLVHPDQLTGGNSLGRSLLSRLEHYYYESLDSEYLAYVLPALAITGLSLLFPNIVTVNDGNRRRRDTGVEETADRTELLLEHLTRVYAAAAESDQCLQRVACELGATASTLKPHHRHLVIKLVGAAAPTKYSNLLSRFKGGVQKAETCHKHGCPLMDQ